MNNTQASHAKWEGKMKIGSEILCIDSLLLSILLPMFYHANALPDKNSLGKTGFPHVKNKKYIKKEHESSIRVSGRVSAPL